MSRTRTLVSTIIFSHLVLAGCTAPAGSEAGVDVGSPSPSPSGSSTTPTPPPSSTTSPTPTPTPVPVGDVSVTTSKSSYAYGEAVSVTVSGMPGGADEGLALAPQGSPVGTQDAFVATHGEKSGTYEFTSAPAGKHWVVRALASDGAVLAESAPFEVQAEPLSLQTDKDSYAPSDSIVVSFTGLSGAASDWIGLARPGASRDDYLVKASPSKHAGTVELSLSGLKGRFVARAYVADAAEPTAESAPFVVSRGTSLTLSKASWAFGETVTVDFHGMDAGPHDWLAVAPLGADPSTFSAWAYTDSNVNGSLGFDFLVSGTFVARAYYQDSLDAEAESLPFDVGAIGALPSTVSADKSSYTGFEDVVATFSGLPGNPADWIGVFRKTDASSLYQSYLYADGAQSGTLTFANPALAFGDYELRAFYDDGYELKGRSGSFSVIAAVRPTKTTYAYGETVAIEYAGLSGSEKDWVALISGGTTEPCSKKYTGGGTAGTASFDSLAAGTYVAQVGFKDKAASRAQSVSFTVLPSVD